MIRTAIAAIVLLVIHSPAQAGTPFSTLGAAPSLRVADDSPIAPAAGEDSDGYVFVPGGKAHKSCVHVVQNGAVVKQSSTPCAYPRRRLSSAVPASPPPNVGPPPNLTRPNPSWNGPWGWEIDGWVQDLTANGLVMANGHDWYTSMSGEFTVPAVPRGVDYYNRFYPPVVFLFQAFDYYPNDFDVILQPVLQYGAASNGGGTYWSIANWYIDYYGQVSVTQPIPVNPGDKLRGSMSALSCTSDGICSWYVQFGRWDPTTACCAETTLNVDGVPPLNGAQKAVEEVYRVVGCDEMPDTVFWHNTQITERSGDLDFYTDVTNQLVWGSDVTGLGVNPDCLYQQIARTPATGELLLNWDPVGFPVPAAPAVGLSLLGGVLGFVGWRRRVRR